MGVLDKLGGFFRAKIEVHLLLVGLDNSGKTTIINCIRPYEEQLTYDEINPTVGLDEKVIRRKHHIITFFDMSGEGRYRPMW